MKKLLTILFTFIALSVSAQNTHKQSNANTVEQFQGAVETKVGLINAHFADTTEANFSWIKTKPFAQIVTGDGLTWLRNGTATRWVGTGTASISVSPDSTSIIICNGSGSCDTIPVLTVAPITNFTILNDTTIKVCGINSCDTIYTLPVNYNQNIVNSVSIVNGVAVDSVFYFINGVKYLAGTITHSSANISIYNDSTLLICNNTSCDTLVVPIVAQPVQNFTVLSDTTIQVCGAYGCDTININPTPFNKFYVDSVVINPSAVDTLKYWINGIPYIGGFVNHLKVVNDGLISGGVVTYSGTGLTYYVSAATYVIGGEFYSSPDTTITLDAADATNPRIDLFAVDTLGHVLKITGIAASTPLTPQVDVSQLALTTGITLAPNATQPTGTSSTLIYDENTEWTTGGTATVNFNNTTNPYHGTKDALVSAYSKNSNLTFTNGSTVLVNGQILRLFIRLNNSNYSFQIQFFNGTTSVSNIITAPVNNSLFGSYQNISIPLSSFTWSSTAFNKLVITMTGKGGTGTYYLDFVSLESGTPIITPPTDYSNKVDSVTTVNGNIYYWVKGISHLVGTASGGTASGIDSASYHTLTINSDTTGATLNRPNGTSDFIPLPFVKKTDTTIIKVHYPVWAFSSDSLGLRTDSMPKLEYAIAGRDTSIWDNYTLIDKQFLQDRISAVTATGITRTELQDTAAAIRSSMGSGSVASVTGNPSALVDNTDPANPVIQQDASKLDKSDSTIANRVTDNTSNIASNTTAIAGKLSNITGLVTQGTNVTVTGSGTSGSPYVINSSGGSSTIDQTLTATAGQTAFVFTSVPTRFLITINGTVYNNYTVSGSTVTVGMTDILAGDKIRLYQTQ